MPVLCGVCVPYLRVVGKSDSTESGQAEETIITFQAALITPNLDVEQFKLLPRTATEPLWCSQNELFLARCPHFPSHLVDPRG